jgi:hypothetical protein
MIRYRIHFSFFFSFFFSSFLVRTGNIIDIEIKKLGGDESGVFVRLSSRSPKDSVQENLYNIYLEEKKNLLLEEGDPYFYCLIGLILRLC